MEWINVKDRLPKKNDVIVYCCKYNIISTVGRYCGEEDPMPSAPIWLPWDIVTHYILLTETPEDL
jgi:hypothetical protein